MSIQDVNTHGMSAKQIQRLQGWIRWNNAMKLLRVIHNEIAPKLQASRTKQAILDSI